MSGALIALDLDGTLEDSRGDMVAAIQRQRRRLGLDARPAGDFMAHVNRGMAHLYRHCFADHLAPAGPADDRVAESRLDALRLAYEDDYLAHIADTTELYPGMADALGSLATLGSLAIVTNKPERLSRALLDALGVAGHFRAVIGGDTCAESKPSPMPLAEAGRQAGCPAGHATVMIGDSAGDIRCARAFGAPVIWCAWGYAAEPGPSAPDFTARSADELPALVRQALA